MVQRSNGFTLRLCIGSLQPWSGSYRLLSIMVNVEAPTPT